MPPTIQIIPHPSTGRKPFEWEASFDMTRSRSLVSENIEELFGLSEIITFPGPVGLTDAEKRKLACSSTIAFNIRIAERKTSVTAWVMGTLKGGQLVIGAGPMEDWVWW